MEITKTQQYLFPSLYFGYDKEFKVFLGNLVTKYKTPVRVNSYVGDFDYKKPTKRCIFILLRVVEGFGEILNTFKEHESYQDDYPVGEFDSDYHMVVCKLNNERAYNYFMVSRYSKMYPEAILETNFSLKPKKGKKQYVSSYHVLNKTEERRLEIIEELGIEDKADAKENYFPVEYEITLDMFEEIFDYKKIK